MNPHSPPTKLARFAELGTGRANWNLSCDLEGDRGDGSPPIALELELGLELGTGYSKRSCGFTFFQLQELQLQSLIYKYMEARLPVPSQLVVPIWKSVASSVSGLSGDLHQLYPSFSGSGPLHFELKNGMDPEPGRCRRTDGKKWRCSKEAIPDHKYCERHVHRGRLRSRKLVEASLRSPITSSSAIISDANASANTSLSISLPAVNSSSRGAGAGINPSPSFIFSPRSVLHDGHNKKLEPSF